MKLNPFLYDRNTVEQIIEKPVIIELGKINFENWKMGEVHEILEGKLIKCILASNYPYKPSNFIFQSLTGKVSEISIGQLISVEILNEIEE